MGLIYQLKLHRVERTKVATRGVLLLNGTLIAVTLEDVLRDTKVQGETAIKSGKYDVIVNHSPRFNQIMPLLLDVPQFTGVRIHKGNTPRDTDGCIIVANQYDYLSLNTVTQSKPAYDRLMQVIGQCTTRGMCDITIINH